MRRITGLLLWLYVFTVPWDIIAIGEIGTSTRLAGILVLGAGILTVVAEGRFRRPDAIFGLAIAFTALAILSLLWTMSYPLTLEAAWQYVQLLGSLWVVREFARTREQHQWLLVAFCLGTFVPAGDLLNHFRQGIALAGNSGRYTATGFNADGLGLLLAICIPIAWHLVRTHVGIVRAAALILFAFAPLGILLTATRGAVLSGLVAVSIVPLSLARPSLRSFVLVTVLLALIAAVIGSIVPQSTWARIATIPGEITGGSMSTRRDIWNEGFEAFPEHPLLGIGAGAYPALLNSRGKRFAPAHNTMVGLLVEQGIVGLSLFTALLGAFGLVIYRMPPDDRKLWAVVMLAWFLAVLSVSGERWKVGWLLFGLLSAKSGMDIPLLSYVRRSARKRADAAARAAPLGAAPSPLAARTSASR